MRKVDETPARLRLVSILPGLIAIVLFANSLSNGFAVDDEWIIERNVVAHDAMDVGRIFTTDYWVAKGSQGNLYRPLTILTYAWNYALGGLNPWGYHLVNVLLHGGVSTLVFMLLRALGATVGVGLTAGVLFAVHPIHVEAVSNIVGRAELLSTGLVLAALLAYIEAGKTPSGSRRRRLFLASFVSFGAALLCKENALTFLALPALYDACFGRTATVTAWRAVRARLPAYCAFLAVALAYLAVRQAAIGALTIEVISVEDNPIAGLSPGTRILTALALTARYGSLMIFPRTLSYIYGPGSFAIATSLLDLRVLAGLGLLVSLVVLLAMGWRRSPYLSFFAGFVLATFSIVSNIAIPIGTAFAERLLYLPSVGILALAAWGLVRLAEPVARAGTTRRRVLTGFVIVFATALAGRSCLRNRDWRSNRTLFLSQLESPVRSSQTTFNAGLMFFQDEDYLRALELFDDSFALYPAAKTSYFQGRSYGALGEEQERVRLYTETATRHAGTFYGELAQGWLLSQAGRFEESLLHFQEALRQRPSEGGARYNVGFALLRTEDFSGAVDVLSVGLESGAQRPERADLLAQAHDRLGDRAAAERVRAAHQLAASPAGAFTPGAGSPSSGYSLMREGRYEEAQLAFQETLAIEPKDIGARMGLGITLYNLGDNAGAATLLETLRNDSIPLDETAYLALAGAYDRQQQDADAAAVLDEGYRAFPASAALLERLAYIEYTVSKDYAAAATHFRKLLDLAPKHPRKGEISAALDWLGDLGY